MLLDAWLNRAQLACMEGSLQGIMEQGALCGKGGDGVAIDHQLVPLCLD